MTAATNAASSGLATDLRSLDRLKLEASRDPKAAVRQAASQFEALFMQQLLKSMRDATPKGGLFDSPSKDLYTGMLDQQLAQKLAGRPSGLGEMIARQLSRNIKGGEQPAVAQGSQADLAAALQLRNRSVESPTAGQPDVARMNPAQADFVKRMWPAAAAAQRATGVPAAFVVGQAALESGWGRAEIRRADGSTSHNLFGIKAGSSWNGATVDTTTTEYIDGKATRRVERFRAYGSYAEAFADWARLMSGNSRYEKVLQASANVQTYAQGMQRAGYATDPAYGAKLERTINQTLALKRLVI